MEDPFRIPTILSSQELLDKAFSRATKLTVQDTSAFHQPRKTAMARVSSVGDTIDTTLAKYIKAFPSFDRLHPYHREMMELAIDVDHVRKSLGALQWAREMVSDICRKAAGQIKKTRDKDFVEKKRSEAFGRISSVIGQVKSNLKVLGEARNVIRVMPSVDPRLPTVVVAGVPNVGKSALVVHLSSAKPQIAQYPFTTKDVHVGYFDAGPIRYQVIDTPGMLDRNPEERNDIERRAAAALGHLGGLMLFLEDASETCGFSLDAQEKLLERVVAEFPDLEVMVVETKVDLVDSGSKRMKVSGQTGQGVEELKRTVVEELRADREAVDRQIMQLMEDREGEEGR
jgi:nucleolar GTP-binding protein